MVCPIIILLVYVDDIIIMGNDPDCIHNVTILLDMRFKLKNLGDLTYFLGFEITRSSKGLLSLKENTY